MQKLYIYDVVLLVHVHIYVCMHMCVWFTFYIPSIYTYVCTYMNTYIEVFIYMCALHTRQGTFAEKTYNNKLAHLYSPSQFSSLFFSQSLPLGNLNTAGLSPSQFRRSIRCLVRYVDFYT